jgi:protease I
LALDWQTLLEPVLKRILIPIPALGFDPSEAAIPWLLLRAEGWQVVFATPHGQQAAADPLLLSGKGLGLFAPVLRARKDAILAYQQMETCAAFCQPLSYANLRAEDFHALLLPGGHAKSVKEYLESTTLQCLVAEFFQQQKPVAAICHGVVLAARSQQSQTGQSVLHGYQSTCLLQSQEKLAYHMTKFWMGDYYLTYPQRTVEEEVRQVLAKGSDFCSGPTPLLRDSPSHLKRGFFVRDRNYLSARWPGDLYSFTQEFVQMIGEAPS